MRRGNTEEMVRGADGRTDWRKRGSRLDIGEGSWHGGKWGVDRKEPREALVGGGGRMDTLAEWTEGGWWRDRHEEVDQILCNG